MRLTVLAAVAAGLLPAIAGASGPMRGSDAGTSWDAPRAHRSMSGSRIEHRVEGPRSGAYHDRYGRGRKHDRRGEPIYGADRDYGYDDRDYEWSDRMDRDFDGDLGYDRDYPYEHPYGGYGQMQSGYGYGGGYTVTETTVTTEPSVVHYIEKAGGVAVHRQTRHTKTKRAYRPGKRAYRAKAAPRCAC